MSTRDEVIDPPRPEVKSNLVIAKLKLKQSKKKRKKKDKSSQRKEKKATQTLAIVLGEFFLHIFVPFAALVISSNPFIPPYGYSKKNLLIERKTAALWLRDLVITYFISLLYDVSYVYQDGNPPLSHIPQHTV